MKIIVDPVSKVLCINSYAGSMMIAAKHLWYPVIGSYEDKGYGLDIQAANFDNVDYRWTRADWPRPKRNRLKGVVVMAHPPCSAFSSMNAGHHERLGIDSPAFACTKDVLEYTLNQGCDALLLESVVPALEGARAVHDDVAERYNYQVYRVLQNSITFALPQWRPRFWCIFIHKRFKLPSLLIAHQPMRRTIADRLEATPTTVTEPYASKLKEQHAWLKKAFGTRTTNDILTRGRYGYGRMQAVLWRMLKPWEDRVRIKKLCVWGSYNAATAVLLDPQGYAPTLMHNSFWTVHGRCLTDIELRRVMGFPDRYVFPKNRIKQHRHYLSRGVCPPVAMWVLDTVERNLHHRQSFYVQGSRQKLIPPTFLLRPGKVADLRPTKKMWETFYKEDLDEVHQFGH